MHQCSLYPLDDRFVVWFDIDNTLYPASVRIAETMIEKIHGEHFFHAWIYSLISPSAFFLELMLNGRNKDDINMDQLHKEADDLHKAYYSTYGLALRGLIINDHGVGKYALFSSWDSELYPLQRSLGF